MISQRIIRAYCLGPSARVIKLQQAAVATFSVPAKVKTKSWEDTQPTAEQEPEASQPFVKKDNPFRIARQEMETPENDIGVEKQSSGKNKNKHRYGGGGKHSDAINLGGNYNAGLAHFFYLPPLEKVEAEEVLAELQKDMDMAWTP